MVSPLSPEVRRFIAKYIDSVALLEVMLVMRASRERTWSAQDMARARLISDEMAGSLLSKLAAAHLVRAEPDGFVYDAPAAASEVIAELADNYAKRLHSVVATIYGSDNRSATVLSDAFRIRRRDW